MPVYIIFSWSVTRRIQCKKICRIYKNVIFALKKSNNNNGVISKKLLLVFMEVLSIFLFSEILVMKQERKQLDEEMVGNTSIQRLI